ncbi:putative hetero-Diels-Alderase asR5 [Paramyrothecium foliicola]|nr:putative hetero-Diels-Alderase asR5 [Paramyrothecium foliicola]
MYLTLLYSVILCHVSYAIGHLVPRQASPRQIVSVRGAWFENIAVRPNGNLLLTRMDVPEVWEYDFSTNKAARVAAFSESLATAGIAELAPDVWAIVSGRYSFTGGGNTPGSWIIHKLDLTGAQSATSVVVKLPQAQLINGLAALNTTHVLPGDAAAGTVYVVDTNTGASRALKKDPSMNPTSSIPFGIDGMKVHNGYLYFTNIATSNILRFSIQNGTDNTGTVETLLRNSQGDDFVIGRDGLMYLATNTQNSVVSIETTTGRVTRLAAVTGSTSTAFGRRMGLDEGTLYVATTGGQVVALDILQGAKIG